jgi:CRISPR-associated protein Cmr1
MQTLRYTVRFTTPAFLGNAEQNGQWRTPPFKALLRQWWRVAYAADHGFTVTVANMRREEGLLFGHAWLEDDRSATGQQVAARRSLVRIRLSKWTAGEETRGRWGQQDSAAQKVSHPEVGQVGPLLYLGYGPLDAQKLAKPGPGKPDYVTVLKRNAAIQAGEVATLSIAVPQEHAARMQRALWLMDRYGTLGGRSRNGWGSFSLTPSDGTPALSGVPPLRPWKDALALDWPHAIGRDESGALVWATQPFADWKQLMRELAIIKIGLRTQFVFPNAPPPHQDVQLRHWLSYPITRHTTRAWPPGARLPNSLRFKIRPDAQDPARLVGVIFHLSCQPPAEFRPDRAALSRTWQTVHALLAELTRERESRTYACISDTGRRAALKGSLDAVRLQRRAP